jgi:Na+-translocating ferredoxin:NAD+ oxidoreductase RnfD subunit
MSERNTGKVILGAIVGLVLGAVVGVHRVTELALEQGDTAAATGGLVYALHSPRFWFIVVVCTIVFAFILGRVGRPTSQSDL